MEVQKNQKNLEKYKFAFVGRLEKEKGIEILLQIIQKSIENNFSHEFHIFWDGRYISELKKINDDRLIIYGYTEREDILKKFPEMDAVIMPSLFLETFGLVALEALSLGLKVIGFHSGGLMDFIPLSLSLQRENPVESFFEIIENFQNAPSLDVEKFSYKNWQDHLKNFTKNFWKILLVHDYSEEIGGAEKYVYFLKWELEKIGKNVEIFSYSEKISPKIRKKLFFETLFSQKNFWKLSEKIHDFSPDLIWSHSVLRFIGPSGMQAIKNSTLPHYMMHHDLGLFAPFPSKTQTISDIPQQKSLQAWWGIRRNFSDGMKNIFKFWLVSRIWKKIPENTLHFVPSEFMKPVVKNYAHNVEVFPHTLIQK